MSSRGSFQWNLPTRRDTEVALSEWVVVFLALSGQRVTAQGRPAPGFLVPSVRVVDSLRRFCTLRLRPCPPRVVESWECCSCI